MAADTAEIEAAVIVTAGAADPAAEDKKGTKLLSTLKERHSLSTLFFRSNVISSIHQEY